MMASAGEYKPKLLNIAGIGLSLSVIRSDKIDKLILTPQSVKRISSHFNWIR